MELDRRDARWGPDGENSRSAETTETPPLSARPGNTRPDPLSYDSGFVCTPVQELPGLSILPRIINARCFPPVSGQERVDRKARIDELSRFDRHVQAMIASKCPCRNEVRVVKKSQEKLPILDLGTVPFRRRIAIQFPRHKSISHSNLRLPAGSCGRLLEEVETDRLCPSHCVHQWQANLYCPFPG